jgi:hypothetical protein
MCESYSLLQFVCEIEKKEKSRDFVRKKQVFWGLCGVDFDAFVDVKREFGEILASILSDVIGLWWGNLLMWCVL